jgi:hypothetical protein
MSNIDCVSVNPIADRISLSKSEVGIKENGSDKDDYPKKHKDSLY